MELIKISSFFKAAKRVDEVFSEVCIEYGESHALESFFDKKRLEINDEFPFENVEITKKEFGENNIEVTYVFKRKKDNKYFRLNTCSGIVEDDFLYETSFSKAVNM